MSQTGYDNSDEGLLAQYRGGREEAFTLIFTRYSRRIFAYVLGLVRDADVADDVTQKVFVKLARRPEAYSPTASFSSWLHRVARNEALDMLKSRSNQVAWEGLDAEGKANILDSEWRRDGERADESVRNDAVQALVARAIQSLEGPQREALVLREYSELSYREIAEITGRSLPNVKQDIFQARRVLREQLAPHLGRMESK